MKNVLIIDDEVDLGMLLQNYFAKKDYNVTIAHTLNEGRSILNKNEPDIIFLDNNLPDGRGWDCAPEFAVQYKDSLIVLVSAFHPSPPHMPTNARYRTIEKPIRFADLKAIV